MLSYVRKRKRKIDEDKEIKKYIDAFQIVKETDARETYRDLKKAVMVKINWEKQKKQVLSIFLLMLLKSLLILIQVTALP